MLNRVRDLLQNKANKPSRRARQPLNSEGNEGDFVISRLKDGLFVFFKVMGRWLKIFHSRTSLIPDQNKAFDIGSPTKRWKNLYLSNDAINIGDNRDTSGKITYDGTDLIFKNKARTESKIVGKRANSDLDSNAGNTISLGENNVSNEHGLIALGTGGSNLGGVMWASLNSTPATQGIRFINTTPASGGALGVILSAKGTGQASAADIECEFKDDIVELLIDEAVSIIAGDINDAAQAVRGSQMAEKNN